MQKDLRNKILVYIFLAIVFLLFIFSVVDLIMNPGNVEDWAYVIALVVFIAVIIHFRKLKHISKT